MPRLHELTHPEPVSDCFGCKLLTIRANKGGLAHDRRAERALELDRQAYIAMRRQGLQPPSVNGSAKLIEQRIDGQFDIDYRDVIAQEDRGKAKEAIAASRDLGLLP